MTWNLFYDHTPFGILAKYRKKMPAAFYVELFVYSLWNCSFQKSLGCLCWIWKKNKMRKMRCIRICGYIHHWTIGENVQFRVDFEVDLIEYRNLNIPSKALQEYFKCLINLGWCCRGFFQKPYNVLIIQICETQKIPRITKINTL